MSRRVLRRRSGGHGRGGGGASAPLILFENGTFTRSSDASFQPDSASVVNVGSNIMRRENGLYLCEGPRTNLVLQSNAILTSPWGAGISSSASADAAASPDGSFTADQLTMDGTGSLGRVQGVTQTAVQYAGSVWIKAASGGEVGKSWRYRYGIGGGPANSFSGVLPASWTRFSGVGTQAAGSATQGFESRAGEPTGGDPALPGYIAYVWGHQNELGSFPTSLIYTTTASATRAGDSLVFAAGTFPSRLCTGRWMFDMEPEWASTEGPAFAEFWTFSTSEFDKLEFTGGNRLRVVAGNTIKVDTGAVLSFSRFQRLRIIVDCAAGSLTVAGATSGNGVYTGTAWTWPTANGMKVGRPFDDLNNNAFSRISEPYAA